MRCPGRGVRAAAGADGRRPPAARRRRPRLAGELRRVRAVPLPGRRGGRRDRRAHRRPDPVPRRGQPGGVGLAARVRAVAGDRRRAGGSGAVVHCGARRPPPGTSLARWTGSGQGRCGRAAGTAPAVPRLRSDPQSRRTAARAGPARAGVRVPSSQRRSVPTWTGSKKLHWETVPAVMLAQPLALTPFNESHRGPRAQAPGPATPARLHGVEAGREGRIQGARSSRACEPVRSTSSALSPDAGLQWVSPGRHRRTPPSPAMPGFRPASRYPRRGRRRRSGTR